MKPRKQFTFYCSYAEAIRELPAGQREAVYDAVCDFAIYGIKTELPEVSQRVAMKLIMPNLESSRRKALAAQGESGLAQSTGSNKKENKNEFKNKTETETERTGPLIGTMKEQSDFEDFWNAYPVKLGRKDAYGVWLRLKPELETVLRSLALWKMSPGWLAEDGRYIPQAKKFLSDGYYRQKPSMGKPEIPYGASGEMGKAEMEAIRRLMEE